MEKKPILTKNSIELISLRIAEHARLNDQENIVVEFHGGEPLLLGKKLFAQFAETLRSYCYPTSVEICVQTNGLLLDISWLQTFVDHRATFSISIDPAMPNIKGARIDKQGYDSTPKLVAKFHNLSQLPVFKKSFTGALCVISTKIDPVLAVDWFYNNNIYNFDFLLPDANHSNPDPETSIIFVQKFLIRAYVRWLEIDDEQFRIRIFQHLIQKMHGAKSGLDALGGKIDDMCVIESDATIHHHDVLRICPDLDLGEMNLISNSIDDFCNSTPSYINQELPTSCKNCKYNTICSGGYLPHRYKNNSFDNPSYYCSALFKLIETIEKSVKTLQSNYSLESTGH